jgi:hypothetical protein
MVMDRCCVSMVDGSTVFMMVGKLDGWSLEGFVKQQEFLFLRFFLSVCL